MTIQFSRQGMAAIPTTAPVGKSSFARRLLQARDDTAKRRVHAGLLEIGDAQLVEHLAEVGRGGCVHQPLCPSRRIVEIMPSAVSGMTNADAPCFGVTPSGKGRTSPARSLR